MVPATDGVVFLGLDACDTDLVERYIAAGELPVLAELFEKAAVSETIAPPGLFVSTTWPTLFTATSVTDHDYVCWIELDPGTYDYDRPRRPRSGDLRSGTT